MSNLEIYESLIHEVCQLTRLAMIDRLTHFPETLRLDFTEEFLILCDNDRLRHLLLAAEWRTRTRSESEGLPIRTRSVSEGLPIRTRSVSEGRTSQPTISETIADSATSR